MIEMPYATHDWSFGTNRSIDGFGIKKLYPGYRYSSGKYATWYINMSDPDRDLENTGGISFKRMSDGTWLVEKPSDGQIRFEAVSPSNAFWRNVEMTAYYRLEYSNTKPPADGGNGGWIFQPYSRGGKHSTTSYLARCDGFAYKGAIIVDPARRTAGCKSALRKEINHPAYATNRFGTGTGTASYNSSFGKGRFWTARSLFYRWLGVKFCIWNYRTASGVKAVHTELWVDNGAPSTASSLSAIVKGNTTRWVRPQQTNDYGGWSTTSSGFYTKCPNLDENNKLTYRVRSCIGTKPATNQYRYGESNTNMASWRSDHSRYRVAFLSVREIAPNGSIR